NNKRRLIGKYKQAGQLLDIGCASGEFLLEMKQHGWQISGMETAPEAREIARQQKITVFETLDELSGSFDVITMWHVLEHVHRIADLFKNIKRLLTADGLLVFAIPNIDSRDGRYYKNHWVALDTPRHLYHFRPQDIEHLLKNYGFELIRISPLLYFDPWYNALLSSRLKSDYQPRSAIVNLLEAGTIGKLSFLNGLINPRRCASPVYVARSRK
ncbi:MAG: class I SAM-dependent methyltransferase, partial [Calditrichales bacterium]